MKSCKNLLFQNFDKNNGYLWTELEEFIAIILVTVKDLGDILCVFGTWLL